MPPRTVPTARQRRLGAELRKMREQAGLSVGEAGERLGVNRTRISNTEAGRFGVSAERVRVLADIYECADADYVAALCHMAEERQQGWWEKYRERLPAGLLDLAELEYRAHGLRAVQMMHFPGLLQTEMYAKAVFSTAVPALSSDAIRRKLSFRMARRDVLDRDRPLPCTFLVHEAALRLRFGGAAVMRDQIEHVVEASLRGNVTVRVIPFAAGGFPNAGSSTLYAEGPVGRLDTVQLDVASGVALVDAEASLSTYRQILDRTEETALSPADSRDFMLTALQQL